VKPLDEAVGTGPGPDERPFSVVVLCRERRISRPGAADSGTGDNQSGSWIHRLPDRVGRHVGGVQVHVEHVQGFLEQTGHQVTVVTPFETPWLLPLAATAVTRMARGFSRPASERWRRTWHRRLLLIAYARYRSRVKGSGRQSLLYAQCPLSAEVALRVREPDQPVVLVMHSAGSEADEACRRGDCVPGDRLYNGLVDAESRVLPVVDGLVFVSSSSAEDVYTRVPAARAVPSIVAPNFLPDDWGRDSTRAPVDRDLVTVGRLTPEKNHRYLIEILAAAKRLGHPYTLTVVGDGIEAAPLDRLCHELGVDQQVAFLGARRDVASVLAHHRVYLHGATVEPFGIVLIEAMAKGLPLLAGPVGGIPEVFRDGIEGRYLPLDSVPDATEIVISLLSDENLQRAYGTSAKQRFHSEFSASVVGPRLEEFFGGLRQPR
jgi:glycosyltransferase involved in cell wall biosynthesis